MDAVPSNGTLPAMAGALQTRSDANVAPRLDEKRIKLVFDRYATLYSQSFFSHCRRVVGNETHSAC
jgi:hypothetical protein